MIEIKEALAMAMPKYWLEFFDVSEIKEEEKEWQITLFEKEELVPKKLQGKEVVQDGYMNPVEVEDYPMRGKLTYLKFFRRRWKEKGDTKGFANEYDFHPEGMKATKEFGSFLKELNREECDFFFSHWPSSGK